MNNRELIAELTELIFEHMQYVFDIGVEEKRFKHVSFIAPVDKHNAKRIEVLNYLKEKILGTPSSPSDNNPERIELGWGMVVTCNKGKKASPYNIEISPNTKAMNTVEQLCLLYKNVSATETHVALIPPVARRVLEEKFQFCHAKDVHVAIGKAMYVVAKQIAEEWVLNLS